MNKRKTIIMALMAFFVLTLGVNFNAEAQLGGLIGAAKDLATQKSAKIPKQKKKGKPISIEYGGAIIGTYDPSALSITFNQKDDKGQQIVYKIDPNTGAVTSHLGNSVGSMSNNGSFVSPKLGTLTVEEATYPNFKVKKDGKLIGYVTPQRATNPTNGEYGRFADEVSPLLVAYIYFGVMLSDGQAEALASGYAGERTTANLKALDAWYDKSTINEIMDFEASHPNAGWNLKDHPEFQGLKVAAVGLTSDKWKEVSMRQWSNNLNDYYYTDWYKMEYYAVYELTNGKNIAMFTTVWKESRYGEIKKREEGEGKVGFFVIPDWQRK
ncbi:MAG: hypothetical protein J6T96_09960 [Bacteroidales bacterium]|nr:hypothetical protein [Bacteroidales bacterium]